MSHDPLKPAWFYTLDDEIIKCPKCAESYCCTTCRLCQGCKDNER